MLYFSGFCTILRSMIDELNILDALLPELAMRADVALGPGDDCAVLDLGGGMLLLAAVDQVAGDVHYVATDTDPAAAGAKLLKRNLSDIAAMGGEPAWALLALAADGRRADELLAFCRGVAAAAQGYGVSLVGGDLAALAAGSRTELGSLTILGRIAPGEIIRRSGAAAGDLLYATGCFGRSFESRHHLDFAPRLAEGRFLAAGAYADAMIDVSDGLLLDARRLAAASGVSIVLDPDAIPRRDEANLAAALGDGEDYELLFTVPAAREAELRAAWPAAFAPLTRIGAVTAGRPGVVDPAGEDLSRRYRSGYEH